MVLELKVPHGDGLQALRPLLPVLPQLHAELRLRRHLLEQPPPHAARRAARQRPDAVGQPAPAVLAVARSLRHRAGWARTRFAAWPVAALRRACCCWPASRTRCCCARSWRATARTRCWRARSAATSRASCRSPLYVLAILLRLGHRWLACAIYLAVALAGSCPTCASSARWPGQRAVSRRRLENARPEMHADQARTLPARYYADPGALRGASWGASTRTCGCMPDGREAARRARPLLPGALRGREPHRAARRGGRASPRSTTPAGVAARCCAATRRAHWPAASSARTTPGPTASTARCGARRMMEKVVGFRRGGARARHASRRRCGTATSS